MTRIVFLIALAALLSAIGHLFLSKGMRVSGDVGLWNLARAALANPWVISGVVLQAAFFGIYLYCLSAADLSFVLPLTAADYILITLAAWWLLGEHVNAARWIGTFLVSVGVALITASAR